MLFLLKSAYFMEIMIFLRKVHFGVPKTYRIPQGFQQFRGVGPGRRRIQLLESKSVFKQKIAKYQLFHKIYVFRALGKLSTGCRQHFPQPEADPRRWKINNFHVLEIIFLLFSKMIIQHIFLFLQEYFNKKIMISTLCTKQQ